MINKRMNDTLNIFENIKTMLSKPLTIALIYSSEDEALSLARKINRDSNNSLATIKLLDMKTLETGNTSEAINYDLLIFVFDTSFEKSPRIKKFTRKLEFLQRDFVTVLFGVDRRTDIVKSLSAIIKSTGKTSSEIVITDEELRINSDQFSNSCVRVIDISNRVLLGHYFPFFRPILAEYIINNTAKQTSVAAMGLFFAPTAGMAVLTAIQIKMILEIAAIYGQDLDAKRVKEVLATMGVGYTARGIAHTILESAPIPVAPIKGAIAYGITLSLGKSAKKYFEKEEFKQFRDLDLLRSLPKPKQLK